MTSQITIEKHLLNTETLRIHMVYDVAMSPVPQLNRVL